MHITRQKLLVYSIAAVLFLSGAAFCRADTAEDFASAKRALSMRQYNLALDLFSKVIDSGDFKGHPLAEAYFGRAKIYFQQKQFGRAKAEVTEALEIKPQNEIYWSYRARVREMMGDETGAIVDYSRRIELNPYSANAYFVRGTFYFRHNKYKEAIADFDKVLELEPKHKGAFQNRAIAYSEIGEYDKAMAGYEQAITADPQNPNNYVSRGNIYLARKDYEKAYADYSAAIRLDPDMAVAYYNRAVVNSNQGYASKALPDARKALSFEPMNTKFQKLVHELENKIKELQ